MSASDLHARGVAALNARRYESAEQLLRAALESSRDPDLTARIQSSRAYLAYEMGEPETAFDLSERALAVADQQPGTLGIVQCQHATLLLRSGRPLDALTAFAEALDSLDDPGERGKAHINRGGVHLAQGMVNPAIADFRAAVPLLDSAGLVVEAAMAQHNLGYAWFLAGDLVAALEWMDRARPTIAPLSRLSLAVCDQDRAEVLLAAGLVEQGRTALESAASLYGRERMYQRRGEAELIIARSALADEPRVAARWAVSARRDFERAAAPAWCPRAAAVELAARIDVGSRPGTLLTRSEGLADELEAQGMIWVAAAVRLQVARLHGRRGEADAARRGLPHAVTGQAPLAVRLLDCDVRAELAAEHGRPADALQHLQAGLADLHSWQSSFGSLDLQTGVVGQGVRLAARGLSLSVESARPDVLFEWSERARVLVSRVQPVRAPEDEQIVADLTELREMAAEGGQRDPEREAELRQRVRERAWQHRGSGEVDEPVTLEELRDSLDEDTALVAYVATADCVVALVVTTEATTWVDLGERAAITDPLGGLLPDLDVAAAEMPDAMGRFVRQELVARLDTIAERLVAPVLDAVGDRSVVLTPSGVLAGVPWTLLPGFTGRPVTIAQSATSWLARRTTPLRSATAGFVAGPRVARAEDEVTAAAKEWPNARVLTGEAADAAAACELAETVDVLHIAAHGRHSAENPLFSGLQLADGPWFGYDIDRLKRAPDVVLLSACEVGRSNVRWGEELLGMTTAWLHAGARCVIASPAAVNDQAAYDVLVAVHQRLAAGLEPAAALAEAVPAVSADTAPVPLICFG